MATDDKPEKAAVAEKTEEPVESTTRTKKKLPNVDDLLAYGPEESWGKERSWLDILSGPFILAVLFFLSFQLLIYVYPDLIEKRSQVPRSTPLAFDSNKIPRKPSEEKKVPEEPESESIYEF